MSKLDAIMKAGTIKEACIMSDADVLDNDVIDTGVYALNIILSGDINGGFTSGITQFAGPSATFKTNFALLCMKAYLDKYEDAFYMFYDSEMGGIKKYAQSMGIDTSRGVWIPVTDIDKMKSDIVNRLDALERGDHCIIVYDSLGNSASRNELQISKEEKTTADMKRAQNIKALFRQITSKINLLGIPMVIVNHSYKSQDMFAKTIVSGGSGVEYASNTIITLSRSQNKSGNELVGHNFLLTVNKGRESKVRSQIPITVGFTDGIMKYSGLMDIAIAGNFVVGSGGWYSKIDQETGEVGKKYRLSDTNTAEFWDDIINNIKFQDFIKKNYGIANNKLVQDDIEQEASLFVNEEE